MESSRVDTYQALRELRRGREARRSSRGGVRSLFSGPACSIFCPIMALGTIVAYKAGAPSWVFLAIGMAAVSLVAVATMALKSRE